MPVTRRRRRQPTLVNRGLGLLEVILPYGSSGSLESCLPPGQRDESGFWFPGRYARPADIFTPAQRELQAVQRRIQRKRHDARAVDGRMAAAVPRGGPAGADAPPETPAAAEAEAAPDRPLPPLSETTLPLPAPTPESPRPGHEAAPAQLTAAGPRR